jgi:hypothetical protein
VFFCTFFTGGAAEKAGLHSGDKIIKVFTPCFVYFLLLVAGGLVLFMITNQYLLNPGQKLYAFLTLSWVTD